MLHSTSDADTIKLLMDELRDAKEFLASVLDGIGEGVVVIDRDFRIISANRGYCNQVKLREDEIKGRRCYEVSHHFDTPCYENGEDCSAKTAFLTGESQKTRHLHFDKDKRAIHIEITSFPIKDCLGNVTAVIEVLTDVSEKVNLEAKRRHVEGEMEKKVKELEEFYSFAVDRELKMMELKEEIEALTGRLKATGSL